MKVNIRGRDLTMVSILNANRHWSSTLFEYISNSQLIAMQEFENFRFSYLLDKPGTNVFSAIQAAQATLAIHTASNAIYEGSTMRHMSWIEDFMVNNGVEELCYIAQKYFNKLRRVERRRRNTRRNSLKYFKYLWTDAMQWNFPCKYLPKELLLCQTWLP